MLEKIAKQRRLLISMGKGRLDCDYLEIRKIENASTFSEENALNWLINNQDIAYKVCPIKMIKERAYIFNIKQ